MVSIYIDYILFAVYMAQLGTPFPLGSPFPPEFTSVKQTRYNNKRRTPSTNAPATTTTRNTTPEAASAACKRSRVLMTTPAGDIQCTIDRIRGSSSGTTLTPEFQAALPPEYTYFEARLRNRLKGREFGGDVMVGLSNFSSTGPGSWQRPQVKTFYHFRPLSASNNNKDINEDVVTTYTSESYRPNPHNSSVLSQQTCIRLNMDSPSMESFFEQEDNLHIRYRSKLRRTRHKSSSDAFISRDTLRNVTPHRQNFLMANLYQIKASESITDDLAAYDLMLRTLASWLAEDNLYDGDEALIKAFQQICTTWKNEAYPITQDFAMVASAFDRHPHTAHNVFDQQPQQDNTEMSFTALENYDISWACMTTTTPIQQPPRSRARWTTSLATPTCTFPTFPTSFTSWVTTGLTPAPTRMTTYPIGYATSPGK